MVLSAPISPCLLPNRPQWSIFFLFKLFFSAYQPSASGFSGVQNNGPEQRLPGNLTDYTSSASSTGRSLRKWVQVSSKFSTARECLPISVVVPSAPESCLRTPNSKHSSSISSDTGCNNSSHLDASQRHVKLPRISNNKGKDAIGGRSAEKVYHEF